MLEVLVAGNVLKNPNTSEEQKATARETISNIRDTVEARVQSLLGQRRRKNNNR